MDFRKVILGLTVVMIFGCETDEISLNKMYLKEIIDPTCYKDQFEYEGGQLISFKRFFGDKVSTITKFKYQNNLLIQIESESENGQDYLIDVEYNSNGQRVREVNTFTHFKNFTHEPYKITSISNFNYNDAEQLVTKHSTFSDSEYSLPTETEFEWIKGNIVKRNYFYIDNQGRHYTSSDNHLFDNKRNYTNQDLAFNYTGLLYDEAVLSKNNVISKPNNYEYNTNGYPIKRKYTIENNEYPVLMNYE